MEFEEFNIRYSDDICNLFLKFKDINKNNGFELLNRKNDTSYDLMEFLYNHIINNHINEVLGKENNEEEEENNEYHYNERI